LQLRLIVSKILDKNTGKNLSEWYLLTNVEDSVPTATIALWYYYRWTIESYFNPSHACFRSKTCVDTFDTWGMFPGNYGSAQAPTFMQGSGDKK